MHIDDSSAMQILEEIKALMDSRMTDKMSSSEEMPDAKGIEMQKVKLLTGGDKSNDPLESLGTDESKIGEPDPSEEQSESPEDQLKEEDLMRKIRKELM